MKISIKRHFEYERPISEDDKFFVVQVKFKDSNIKMTNDIKMTNELGWIHPYFDKKEVEENFENIEVISYKEYPKEEYFKKKYE